MEIRGKLWTRIKQHKVLYLMFAPILIYYILIRYWPIVLAWILSFKDFKLGSGILDSQWVGFNNFIEIFSNPEIVLALKNTVIIGILRLLVGFLPPILLAIIFNDMVSRRFKQFAQTAVYIPYFFSWVIVYGVAYAFFSTGFGLVNNVFEALGFQRQELLTSTVWFRPILLVTALWKEVGWGTIIYMAALATIDPQLYESAKLDGAGPIKRIIHITFPSILPVVTFVLCIQLGFLLISGSEQVLMFYNVAVYDVGDIIDTWVYRRGLGNLKFSLGAAVGLLQSVFGMILILISNKVSKRLTGNGIW